MFSIQQQIRFPLPILWRSTVCCTFGLYYFPDPLYSPVIFQTQLMKLFDPVFTEVCSTQSSHISARSCRNSSWSQAWYSDVWDFGVILESFSTIRHAAKAFEDAYYLAFAISSGERSLCCLWLLLLLLLLMMNWSSVCVQESLRNARAKNIFLLQVLYQN